jgi:hypothetical protein
LLNLDGHIFGIAKIYASKDMEEMTFFLRWTVDEFPKVHKLVCEDFCMVDVLEENEGKFPIRVLSQSWGLREKGTLP